MFTPTRTDDLRPEWLAVVGQTAVWRFAGVQPEGYSYAGQQTWYTYTEGFPSHWVPAEDLTLVNVRSTRDED